MATFKINSNDFSDLVSGLRVGYETLVSGNSGRNANGDTVLDVINRKIKLQVNFRYMTSAEMTRFLDAIKDYVITVSFLDPKTQAMTDIVAYTGTPEPEYYTASNRTIFKPMNLNFIEL